MTPTRLWMLTLALRAVATVAPGAVHGLSGESHRTSRCTRTNIVEADLFSAHHQFDARAPTSNWTYDSMVQQLFQGVAPLPPARPPTLKPVNAPPVLPWSLSPDAIDEIFKRLGRAPNVFLEVGTYWGYTAVRVAQKARLEKLPTFVVCVDTWLGDSADFLRDDFRQHYATVHADLPLYSEFVENVYAHGAQSKIIPLRVPSLTGARLLQKFGFLADVVYVDASHDWLDSYMDVMAFMRILSSDGIIFGDDYHINDVKRAVDDVAAKLRAKVDILTGATRDGVTQQHWVMQI